jgi:hypothetical protein
VELVTLERVSWFNHHRLLHPIGYLPPAEAEVNYYQQLPNRATLEVQLKPNSLLETPGGSHSLSNFALTSLLFKWHLKSEWNRYTDKIIGRLFR